MTMQKPTVMNHLVYYFIIPRSGIAFDDSGTLSAITSWKTVIDSNSVIPMHTMSTICPSAQLYIGD